MSKNEPQQIKRGEIIECEDIYNQGKQVHDRGFTTALLYF